MTREESGVRLWGMGAGQAWTGVALFLLTGCGDSAEAPPIPRAVVRDSAGITIVENERPRIDVGWSVGDRPELAIGTLEGEPAYQLFQVVDASLLDDERIVVANRGSNELRVYDAAGAHVASWGGEGEGPGEFTGLSAIERWPGDSLMAYDFRQRRITLFDLDGNLGRTFSLEATEEMPVPQFLILTGGGDLVVRGATIFTGGEPGTGLIRNNNDFAIMSPRGEITASLGSHAGNEMFVTAGERFVSVRSHPFGRETVTARWGDRIVLNGNDTYEIRVFAPDGSLERIVRRDHEATTPSQADLDAHFREQFGDLTPEQRKEQLAQVAEMPLVERFPAYREVLSDALGYLWVGEFRPPGETRSIWTIFDPEGEAVGMLETPEGLTVLEVGREYILGRSRDELDVEYVQRWSLRRGS